MGDELNETLKIDRLDAELLAALGRDARIGVVELAGLLGVARNTVQARMNRLEAAGIFAGFVPRISLADIGVGIEAFVTLTLEQAKFSEVIDQLAAIPQVLEIHVTTGHGDLLVRVAVRALPELQDLIHRMVDLPGVAHSDTAVSLTTPLPYRVQSLLDEVTRGAGWGRSTPPATAEARQAARQPGARSRK
jgi:DNA-binding Lrp family transcriptional regulator